MVKRKKKVSKQDRIIYSVVIAVIVAVVSVLSAIFVPQTKTDNSNVSVKQSSDAGNQPFAVHYIDVGQGDSSLICCDDYYILIDGGKAKAGDVVVNYLKNLGIKKLDLVIATHPDSDHYGGLADVIENFKIDSFLCPNVNDTVQLKSGYTDLLDELKDYNVSTSTAGLNAHYVFGNGTMDILAPISVSDVSESNDLSTVCKFTYGNSTFLFTGDATSDEEEEMISVGADVKADILKVGHHGSKYSTSWDFLCEVSPVTAVISCGVDNDYGHPTQEVLDRLYQVNCGFYRTDEQGTIIIGTDGEKYYFSTEKE